MDNFKVDTPDNIHSLSDEDIIKLCEPGVNVKSPKSRVSIIKIIYKLMGYDISNDLLYALADEPKVQLIIATAGGGKTTGISVKLALEQIYRKSLFTTSGKIKGDRILSLVFNSSNVPDMVNRYTSVIKKINSAKFDGIELDYHLECRTMHSFCLKWITEYAVDLGIVGYKKIENDLKNKLLMTAINKVCAKEGITKIPTTLRPDGILNARNFCIETKTTMQDNKDSDKIVDLGVDVSVIEKILMIYDISKKSVRRFDDTDLLILFKKLMDTNEEARRRIVDYYDVITADEVQDFTPFLMDILKSLVGEHTQLYCIGDDDQSIYSFRGADNDNALRFKDIFPEAKIHTLRTNRRCPSNVIDLGNKIIHMNTKRFPKIIEGVRGPGVIDFRGYNDRMGQFLSIVNLVKEKEHKERNSMVIAYRNRNSSIMLSYLLYESGVPFHVSSGVRPLDFPLFSRVMDVMKALQDGKTKSKLLDLYKVLPITRQEVEEALGYNPDKSKFEGGDYIDIDKIPFSAAKMSNAIFKKHYTFILQVAKHIDTAHVKDYMPRVIYLVLRNYYNFISQDTPAEINDFCTKKCLEFFDKSFNFREIYGYYLNERTRLYSWEENREGVCLTTFHKLKGLEFDNVVLCDLEESIFPNFSMIDFRPYSEEVKLDLKECENRLMYVAVTRAKKNLYLYYNKHDPSIYITMFKDSMETQESLEDVNRSIVFNNKSSFADSAKDIKPSESLMSQLGNLAVPSEQKEVTEVKPKPSEVREENPSVEKEVREEVIIEIDSTEGDEVVKENKVEEKSSEEVPSAGNKTFNKTSKDGDFIFRDRLLDSLLGGM